MTKNWAAEDGHGTHLCEGATRKAARESAKKWADANHLTARIYCDDGRSEHVEPTPTFTPTGAEMTTLPWKFFVRLPDGTAWLFNTAECENCSRIVKAPNSVNSREDDSVLRSMFRRKTSLPPEELVHCDELNMSTCETCANDAAQKAAEA